ncbi:5'-nucleotidase [Agrobacterium tumefaciens]|uniref:5'-nucleotidase n=1 Tax=Agrobacterium tumefaciens TaxID=358 RepID=UPI0015726DBB|nr:5'-nucleotidase [Agrobacterium tumefaciens]
MIQKIDEKGRLLQAAPLRIGISTRALFDLEEEHAVFEQEGVWAYAALQLKREGLLISKGTGFDVIERLLRLNVDGERPFVEVVLLSRNSPDLSLRAFNSIHSYRLGIKTGSFTSGRPIGPYVSGWAIDLFLSNEDADVRAAVEAGAAAAKLGLPPANPIEIAEDEVRIAFDGDAVVFSAESDEIYKQQGLAAFMKHERDNATKPMSGGPFGNFLKKLSILRDIYMDDKGFSKVRIAIVTARNAPAHARVVHTLRAWGTPADEAHFVGAFEKAPILKACGAHIFFDDQEKHVLGASAVVPAGHVPGPHEADAPVIPAA